MHEKQMEYLKHELNTKLSDKQYTRHEILFLKNCNDKLFSIQIDCIKLRHVLSGRITTGYQLYTTDPLFEEELNVDCESKEEVIQVIEKFIKNYERFGGLRLA